MRLSGRLMGSTLLALAVIVTSIPLATPVLAAGFDPVEEALGLGTSPAAPIKEIVRFSTGRPLELDHVSQQANQLRNEYKQDSPANKSVRH